MKVQPFYCPYCGEEDFVPVEEAGGYACNSCGRQYVVKLTALSHGE